MWLNMCCTNIKFVTLSDVFFQALNAPKLVRPEPRLWRSPRPINWLEEDTPSLYPSPRHIWWAPSEQNFWLCLCLYLATCHWMLVLVMLIMFVCVQISHWTVVCHCRWVTRWALKTPALAILKSLLLTKPNLALVVSRKIFLLKQKWSSDESAGYCQCM